MMCAKLPESASFQNMRDDARAFSVLLEGLKRILRVDILLIRMHIENAKEFVICDH
jgi:hypothetical protein